MSIRCMAWAWSVSTDTSCQKFLLLALADHANDTELECWPSMSFLSEKCSMERRQIQRLLKQLEDQGFIAIERRKNGTSDKSNVYKLLIPNELMEGAATSRGGGGYQPRGGAATSRTNPNNEPKVNPKGERTQIAIPKPNPKPLALSGEKRDGKLHEFDVARCGICDPPHDWKVREAYCDYYPRELACPDWRNNIHRNAFQTGVVPTVLGANRKNETDLREGKAIVQGHGGGR